MDRVKYLINKKTKLKTIANKIERERNGFNLLLNKYNQQYKNASLLEKEQLKAKIYKFYEEYKKTIANLVVEAENINLK